jgi:hypothetical protein
MLMENTDFYTRTWTDLVEAASGRTLELAPGARADVAVPDEFADPFLKPAKTKNPKTSASEPAANVDETKE